MTVETIRVLIADDHEIVRRGLRGVLEAEANIEVIADAGDGLQAIELAKALVPDVVIVDINLPGASGIEVTRALKLHFPRMGIITITAFDDEDNLFEAMKAGASAFFLKDVSPADLLSAIRQVHAGAYLINEEVLTKPVVASRVLKQFRDLAVAGKDMEPLFVPLSPREMGVLEYIAKGNSNKQIARALTISDQTVKNHITSILRKLAVNDRTEAVVFAFRKGWIKV